MIMQNMLKVYKVYCKVYLIGMSNLHRTYFLLTNLKIIYENKKTKHAKFSEKKPNISYHGVSGGKKCSFFRKFGVHSFLVTSVLSFVLLPYYQRNIIDCSSTIDPLTPGVNQKGIHYYLQFFPYRPPKISSKNSGS